MEARPRPTRTLVAILALLWCSAPSAEAQPSHHFSMLLDSGPRNVIYATNARTRVREVASRRLEVALGPYDTVRAISLSMGRDGTDWANPHGLLMFSVKKPPVGVNIGTLNSAVFLEPQDEVQADIYGIPHRPSTSRSLNIKVADENSGTLPPDSDQYLPLPTLGLVGGTTGKPSSSTPDELIGFDQHLPSERGWIFFTVDQPIQVGNNIYTPRDILYLDENDDIQLWRSGATIGLAVGDRIDGLSVCLSPPAGSGVCCLLSIDATSTVSVPNFPNGGSSPIRRGDILIYRDTVSSNKLTRWASPLALGLIDNIDPDADGITSIDPKRFHKDSKWATATPPFGFVDISLGGGSFSVKPWPGIPAEVWNEVKETISIDWDFDLSPLGTGVFTPNPELVAGEEQRVFIRYLLDGAPGSHYDLVEVAPTLNPRPFDTLPLVLEAWPIVQFAVPPTSGLPAGDQWFLTYGAAPLAPAVLLPSNPPIFASHDVEWTLPRPFQVEARLERGGKRTSGAGTVVWPIIGVPTPTDLSYQFLNETQVLIDWAPDPTAGSTSELVIDDGDAPPTTVVGPPPFLFQVSRHAYHLVTVRTIDSAGQRSMPLAGSFYSGIRQELRSNRTIPATPLAGGPPPPLPFPPGDLTLDGATASLVVLSRGGGNVFWTLDTVDHGAGGNAVSHNLADLEEITGVTSLIETVTDPTGASSLLNCLVFAGSAQGVPRLIVTEAETPFPVIAEIDVLFPTPPLNLGAIALEADSRQLLWVADGRLHTIDFHQGSGSPVLDAQPIEELGHVTVDSVSSRDLGTYEVPVREPGAVGVTHLLTLDADHRVVSSQAFRDPPLDLHGLVHAHDSLPTVYVSADDHIRTFTMPLRVGPADDSPFRHRGIPFDLDNNGTAFDPADQALFSAFASVVQQQGMAAAIQLLIDSLDVLVGWDVDGTDPTFPGDGQITDADVWVLFDALVTGAAPPSICVPVHPTWFEISEATNPGCP